MRDAVIAALNLNIFMRNADRVRGANIAQMINVLQAMILTDGPKMVLTPTYHVYQMYVPFQDATLRSGDLRSGRVQPRRHQHPGVDAAAARDTSGKLWLALVNVDANRPARITTGFAGVNARSASGRILTAAAADAHNDFDKSDQVAPKPYRGTGAGGGIQFDIPAKSIAVVEIR